MATGRVLPHVPAEVPTMGRPSCLLGLVAGVGIIVSGLGGNALCPAPWDTFFWTSVALWFLVGVIDQRRFAVGLSIEVRRGLSSTRFAIDEIEWVLTSSMAPAAWVRVRRPRRRVGPVPLPNLVPWPTTVRTYVTPWTWTTQLGVPDAKVGRHGWAWWRPKRD